MAIEICDTEWKTPWAEPFFHFNFTDLLPSGVTVNTIDAVGSTLVSGSASPALAVGSEVKNGTSTQVQVTVTGGADGSVHKIYCRVTFTDGQKEELVGLLNVSNKCA